MDNEAKQLSKPATGRRKLQPVLKVATAKVNAIMYRMTDGTVPWTYDNAPAWLHKGLNWTWTWGLAFALGFAGGITISVAFLVAF